MSLNATPSGERVHIAFFGRRNAGKSSLVNAFTGQDLAIVSDVKGTTTDPVSKAMELLPLGPVQIIDTPGLDDEGELGTLRVQRTKLVLRKTDLAILVAHAAAPLGGGGAGAARPHAGPAGDPPHPGPGARPICWTPCPDAGAHTSCGSAPRPGCHIQELKELAARLAAPARRIRRPLVSDLLAARGGTAVLVVPIDKAAPKGQAHPAPAAGDPGRPGGRGRRPGLPGDASWPPRCKG